MSNTLIERYRDYLDALRDPECPLIAESATFWSFMSDQAMQKGDWARTIAYKYLFDTEAVPMTLENKWIYDEASLLVSDSYTDPGDERPEPRVCFDYIDKFSRDHWLLLTKPTDECLQQRLVRMSKESGEALKLKRTPYNLVVGFGAAIDHRDLNYFGDVIEMEYYDDRGMGSRYYANHYPVGGDLIKYMMPHGFYAENRDLLTDNLISNVMD